MNRSRALIIARGRVQGVFYRATAQNKAKELLLNGWVKNKADGSVEMIVEGEKSNIEQFIEWAKQGSAPARVSELEVKWEEFSGKFNDFHIEYI